jgi:predicted metalloprotease
MRWESGRRSDNVEDRRGLGGGPMMIGGGMSIGGLIIVLLLMCAGVDPRILLQQPGGGGGPVQPGPEDQRVRMGRIDPGQDKLVDFTRAVLGSTEDIWTEQFRQMGRTYHDPKLILFTGQTDSACGYASAAVGPFYCPADDDVYLDLNFFEEMRQRFHASGDTAHAYVIAHEVGHHVQNQLGISERVDRLRERASKRQANELSVRLELQADYLAGVWAHHAAARNHDLFEPGDIEEALRAASSIGDDRLQMQSQGYVVPDAFTHGTSNQRLRWLRKGYETGDLKMLEHFFTADEL